MFAVGAVAAVGGLLLRRKMPESDPAPPEQRARRTPFMLLWREYRVESLRILLIGGSGLVVLYGMVTLLPSLGPAFTSISVEQAIHIGTGASW